MTRKEIYSKSWNFINKNPILLLESVPGTGKTKISIDLVNALIDTKYQGKKTSMLLLVAKNMHKITWAKEFEKWGGIKVDTIVVECYESLCKHVGETFDFVVLDEVHHIKSEKRSKELESLHFSYMIGLSGTIPKKLKQYMKFRYNSWIVSCDIVEAIEDEILPEPKILLLPLELDNKNQTETWEINPKAKGPLIEADIKDFWKYKKMKRHAIFKCTPRRKLIEYDALIAWRKNMFMNNRSDIMKNMWLHLCGERLEFLANSKNPIVLQILHRLKNQRTITFCKTIEQAETLGSNCIHSKNKDAVETYNRFNDRKIKHITAVNILNENANLVDCKYAVFANLSSSEIIVPQRIGRSLRHPSPVIIVPYYKGTREEEIVAKMFADYDKRFIKYIKSIDEI